MPQQQRRRKSTKKTKRHNTGNGTLKSTMNTDASAAAGEMSIEIYQSMLRKAKSAEESERCLAAALEAISEKDRTFDVVDCLIRIQFLEAPYHGMFEQGRLAMKEEDFRRACDLLWDCFQQATKWGDWSPGRTEILGLYVMILTQMKTFRPEQKDARRLKTVFYDKTELTHIRMMAASIFLKVSCAIKISIAEKYEIMQTAKLLEPTKAENERLLPVCYAFHEQDSQETVNAKHVSEIIQYWRDEHTWKVEQVSTNHGGSCREFVPPNVDTGLFLRTTAYGGGQCDCCQSTLEELGVTKLEFCSQCENAYYCGPECQRKAWKNGHKEACRPPGCFVPGDIAHLIGLKSKPEMNGRLVTVVEQVTDDSSRFLVRLFDEIEPGDDTSTVFSVKTKSLTHIRPAA